MSDLRKANVTWNIRPIAGGDGNSYDSPTVAIAVLMDIRDELQKLNRLLHCVNFMDIPRVLRAIRANTSKPRKKKAKKGASS